MKLDMLDSATKSGSDKAAASRRVASLLTSMSKEEVVALLLNAIESHPEPFQTALALEVIKLAGIARLRPVLDKCPISPLIEGFDEIVRAILCSDAIPPRRAKALRTASAAEADLNACLGRLPRFCEFGRQTERHLNVEAFLSSPVFNVDPAIDEAITAQEIWYETKEQILANESRSAYQGYAIRHGALHVNDIYSGKRASFMGSYFHYDKAVYRFRGQQDQYLICVGPQFDITGLYLSKEDLFLHFGGVDPGITGIDLARIKASLSKAMLKAGDKSPEEIDQNMIVRVRIGGVENYAHHIWNYISGLERINRLDLLGKIKNIDYVGTEFFGPIKKIYPELALAKIGKDARGAIDRSNVNNLTLLPIPIGSRGLFVSGLRRISCLAAEAMAEPDMRELGGRIRSYRNRIYVALRVDSRSWMDADRQVHKLINHALAIHPDTCFVIDGFSVPVGEDHASSRWLKQRDELDGIVSRILENVEKKEQVINIIGLDLLQSIAIAQLSTAYICPVGTAHHKIDWFTDIGGVVYLSRDYEGIPHSDIPGLALGSRSKMPAFVFGDDADPETVRLRTSSDRREKMTNFTCSWRTIWAALAPQLEGG